MNLLKAAAAVSGMTLLSRITGLMRETLVARGFGASAETDAFFVAFRLPNLLRRLFAEGAFAQAFVPVLGYSKAQRGEAATKTLVDDVATVLMWALIAITVLGIVAAPLLVAMMAAGLKQSANAFDLTVQMTRWMFPYILLISLVSLSAGILNTWRNFKLPAFTPVLLNLAFIVCALFLAPYMHPPVLALAVAVIVGGVAQLAIQVPALRRIGMLPHLKWNLKAAYADPDVRKILKLMLPATLSVSVAQISLIINTQIASWQGAGAVSWLSYADRLMEFPTAMLGVALGTVLIPMLSKANAEGDRAQYSQMLDWGLRLTFLLALPAALGLCLLAQGLTATLFHYGRFDAHDVQMTQHAVIAYGVGLLGLVMIKILAPGFYARQDVKTPMKIALLVLCATQLMNLLFVPYLKHAGLALSIGLAALLNAALLYWGLRRAGAYQPQPQWWEFLCKLLVGLTLMGLCLWWLNSRIDWLELRHQPMLRIGVLIGVIGASGLVYFATLAVLGFRPQDFKRQ
ncbi:MAG: murein biosynthesis integral membrane protein MurJ [Burkholderiaceae bacterium]|nr:MAG: murein biosynthesis integral membrane protein MurJ [Burkholderiaceae bacterium]